MVNLLIHINLWVYCITINMSNFSDADAKDMLSKDNP